MWRVIDRLQEVFVYERRTTGGLLQGKIRTHLLFEENVLHSIFRLKYEHCKSMLFLKVSLML